MPQHRHSQSLTRSERAVNILMDIVLTDGEGIFDSRKVHPVDLYILTSVAQKESQGELWWEPHSVFLGRKFGVNVKLENQLPFDLITECFTPLAIISSNLQLCIHDDWGVLLDSRVHFQHALDQVEQLAETLQLVQSRYSECD